MPLDVVTGAFSYTGRAIAEVLLADGRELRSLSRRAPEPADPLAGRVAVAPLQFADPEALGASLAGADTLYSTYWIRYERGGSTFERAVANGRVLFDAAARAGVRRIVLVSVAKPSESSPLPYFRGKAHLERALAESGVPYAILRPTLVFGRDDILLNDIAWALRRSPVFAVAGDGRYLVQPVALEDVARWRSSSRTGLPDGSPTPPGVTGSPTRVSSGWSPPPSAGRHASCTCRTPSCSQARGRSARCIATCC